MPFTPFFTLTPWWSRSATAAVDNKAAYLVTGVDADGFKHVLGIWLGTAEGSRFWAGVLAELRNRGIKDVLFVCCDCENKSVLFRERSLTRAATDLVS